VDTPSSVVRIVLLERPEGASDAGVSGSSAVRDALMQIGAEVELVRASATEAGLASARERATDLVVLDRIDPALWAGVVEGLGTDAAPVVGVIENGSDAPMDAFRAGVADCVRADAAGCAALPVVALEQIRRHRPARARASAQRRIASLERFSASVVEHMGSGLLVLDEGGTVRYANPAAESILGVDRSGVDGRPVESLLGAQSTLDWVRGVIAGGPAESGRETLLALPDGTRRPVGLSCAPMQDEGVGPGGAVLILEDLSELKQLQRQIMQSEKMASIGQLAAGVAHEINNPTGFIHANLIQLSEYLADLDRLWPAIETLERAVGEGELGAAEAAAAKLDELKREVDLEFLRGDLGQAVRECQEGAERIRHIVQDLRDFSHQDTGRPEMADVNPCVESTAHIVWTMMRNRALLEKDYGDLSPIRCLPMQLKQVFMNLLVNAYQAIEARPEGSKPGVIRIETRAVPDGVVVRIADTGVGIDAAHLGRIFDPFFTTKEPGEGTGLGLSLSYAIVKRHGGRLDVESEPGEGTRFELWLPHAMPEDEETDGEADEAVDDVS